jgi:hypothetical protein
MIKHGIFWLCVALFFAATALAQSSAEAQVVTPDVLLNFVEEHLKTRASFLRSRRVDPASR